jgi:ribosome-associated toxin RatA of RatAB toxin-antitoxin module
MPKVQKYLLVTHSAKKMFDLVQDIEAYPRFLPWCGGATVVHLSPSELEASIQIAFKGIRQSFATRNQFTPNERITMHLKEGPFKALSGQWVFTALHENACKIEFELDYDFSSKLLEGLIGPVFNMIVNSFVECFVKRANTLFAHHHGLPLGPS